MFNRGIFPVRCRHGKNAAFQQLRVSPTFSCRCYQSIFLRVIKIDAQTGRRLEGACFCLSDGACKQYQTTDKNGLAVFCVSPFLDYCLTETSSPRGYQASAESYRLHFKPDGKMRYKGCFYAPCLIISNCPKQAYSFYFYKTSASTGMFLSGARFFLRAGEQIVAEAISDAQGKVVFCNIMPGEYQLAEVAVPQGYRLSTQEYTVIVGKDGTTTINGIPSMEFCFNNMPVVPPFLLAFQKMAIEQAGFAQKQQTVSLPGATFELRDGNGAVLLTATSDAAGIVTLGTVNPGTYTLVETVSPPGFILGGPYVVKVFANGEIFIDGTYLTDFVAENLPLPNLVFTKTDSRGDVLQNAVFALDNLAGTIQYATSDASGAVIFCSVSPGRYGLSEVAPPFGFLPDSTAYLVEVGTDGTIKIDGFEADEFTVVNIDGPTLSFVKTAAI